MRESVTVKGPKYRVQILCLDLTGPDVPQSIRRERPNWCVRVLPADANRYHAFSLGRQVYWGDDPDHAWDVATFYTPSYLMMRQIPRDFMEHMKRWWKNSTSS
jgi:hypothetical protein